LQGPCYRAGQYTAVSGWCGEETVLARVGEGIVSSIGSALSHKEVMENPDNISKVVLNKGLDAGTALRFSPSILPTLI